MLSGQLSYMHRPRFAYVCKRRRHSLGPETRNPTAHYCTLSGRNHIRPRNVFKMLAGSILKANGSSAKSPVALTNIVLTVLFLEKAAGHCCESEHSHVACGSQALEIGMCARDANESKLR